jgi:hypothetical protein
MRSPCGLGSIRLFSQIVRRSSRLVTCPTATAPTCCQQIGLAAATEPDGERSSGQTVGRLGPDQPRCRAVLAAAEDATLPLPMK